MTPIQYAADAFRLALEAERQTNEVRKDLELDVRIAERAGDAAALASAQKAQAEQLQEWAALYRTRNKAAKELCLVLEIDENDLRSALA